MCDSGYVSSSTMQTSGSAGVPIISHGVETSAVTPSASTYVPTLTDTGFCFWPAFRMGFFGASGCCQGLRMRSSSATRSLRLRSKASLACMATPAMGNVQKVGQATPPGKHSMTRSMSTSHGCFRTLSSSASFLARSASSNFLRGRVKRRRNQMHKHSENP